VRNQPALDFLNCTHPKLTYSFGNEFLFRYPVELMESIAYKPDQEESGAQNETDSVSPITVLEPRERRKSALLSRFATELYDVKKIVETIHTEKLKSQKPKDICYQIEQALGEHSAIRQVAVRFRNDASEYKRLIAYVVADQKNSPVISGHARYLLPNNMAIVHQNKIETDIRYKEIFTDQTYLKHGIVINEGDCIFDVGANIGMFTLFIQQVCNNTRIYAFEPVPQLYEMLCINTALYAPSAELFNCGLSDENKKMTITFYPHATGRSSYYPEMEINDSARRFFLEQQAQRLIEEDMPNRYIDEMLERASITETFTTQLTTLSDILVQSEIDRINLLKIDVERSELDVLFGINKQDWRRIDQIVMEVHSEILLDKVMSVLKSNYYHIVVDQPALYKDFEHFMLYAIQEQSLEPSLSGKEVKLTCDRPLTTPSTHLLPGKELRDFLKNKMPRLTMPLDVMFLDALPRYASGELNNQALPVPNRTNCDLDRSSAEPLTFVQGTLCRIWEEVLVIDKVDLYDNFFDIGGQSLLGTVVMSHIQTTFQVELPLLSIFKSPTVAELAQLIEQHLIDQLDPTELNEELEELKRLSDEEVKELLAHKNTLLAENDSEVSS
jgi:FkbM family methyltransferase